MKNLLLFALLLGFQFSIAQKIGYIEMDSILPMIPAYTDANKQIDEKISQWQSEIDTRFQSIDAQYQEYVQNQSRYSDEIKQQKQNAIVEAEKDANEFKSSIFGPDGELAKLQEKKLKAIIDNVYKIAQQLAKSRQMDYMFDKSGESNWIYSNPDLNLTGEVIKSLGL